MRSTAYLLFRVSDVFRMALGASYREIVKRVTGEVAAMLVLGSLAGLIAGLLSQRYIQKLLYQVHGTDPSVVAEAALTVFAVAPVSALPPVLRALHLQPSAVLRTE